MQRFIYEAIFSPAEEGGFDVSVPDLPGCFTYGENLQDATEMAVDSMKTYLADIMQDGEAIPKATYGHSENDCMTIAVSFEVDASYVVDGDVVSAAEAAKELGVSRSRVSHMIRDGVLDAYREGRSTFVTKESIERRLAAV